MNEWLRQGYNPDQFNFNLNPEESVVADYVTQLTQATYSSWGQLWPRHISAAVTKSGLFHLIAETSAKAVAILGMHTPPKLGLLSGAKYGKMNYLGYCWDGEDGNVWVGLEDFWVNSESNIETNASNNPDDY